MPRTSWTITGPICVCVYHSDDIGAACKQGRKDTSHLLLHLEYSRHGSIALRKPALPVGCRRNQLVLQLVQFQKPVCFTWACIEDILDVLAIGTHSSIHCDLGAWQSFSIAFSAVDFASFQ